MSLSPKTVEIIKKTAPVVAANALNITSTFYQTMFKNNPEVLAYFNKSHQNGGKQSRALADSIIAYASNIDNLAALKPLVERIAHRHVALSVTPEMYGIVHSNLMKAIGEVLGDAVTPEIGQAWSEAVLALADILINAEKDLYASNAKRQGGWHHEKKFKVSKKEEVAADSVRFEFIPVDGKKQKYEFTPGQYLTLRVPQAGQMIAPRHYTITSAPGETYLQCVTKKVDEGVLSNFLHKNTKVGDEVLLGAPCGVFHPETNFQKAVLVSAGIGITPMLNFARTLGKNNVVQLMHFDRDEKHHALKADFAKLGVKVQPVYTGGNKATNISEKAKELVKAGNKDAAYYVCGPVPFMDKMIKELHANGANNTYYEVYGTGTIETNQNAQENPTVGRVSI